MKGAVPLITVRPQSHGDSFNIDAAEKLAADFGRFKIPIFIQLYPNPHAYGFDKDIYKKFFADVKVIFENKAPNVAFVWGTENSMAETEIDFYPGDMYVDWVGMSIYKPIYKNGNINTENIYKGLDFFYYTFQGKKPMMISSVGFSHYTTANHKYDIKGCQNNIKEFYDKLEKEYPLIKVAVYSDYSNVEHSPKGAVGEDYTVTGDEDILAAFSKAISRNYFLTEVLTEGEPNRNIKYLLKSPYKGYYTGGKAYISKSTYEYFLKKAVDFKTVLINGEKYVEIEDRTIFQITENGVILKG